MKELKRLLALCLALVMVLGMVNLSAFAAEEGEKTENENPTETRTPYCGKEEHTHSIEAGCYELTCDQEVGDGAVEGHDCNHMHDGACGYVEAKAEVPCDKNCTDTDGDGVIDHVEGCAYQAAVEGSKCNHSHDDTCGYAEAVEGHTHTEDCYATEASCGLEEHTHTTACYMQWDEETATLTITGMSEVTKADVQTYKSKAQHVVIKGVDTIAKEAFAEWKQLKTVNISNVGTVGYAFRSTSVEEVTIDQVGTIETNAFFNPANLKKVTISNVGTVGKTIFSVYNKTTSLTEVSLSNMDVGEQMFAGHDKLTDLTLNNVGTIGFQAFMNCTGLKNIAFISVEEIGPSAFLGCTGLTKLELNGGKIGNTAFYGCTGLAEVDLTKVTSIGLAAFTGCTGLKSVRINDTDTIGQGAFSNYGNQAACTALETVTLTGIGTIGQSAFQGCNGLTAVTITGVDTVGVAAFTDCTALATLNMTNVNSVGRNAFCRCSGLKTVNMDNVTIKQEDLYYKDKNGKSSYYPPFINAGAEGMTLTVKGGALGGHAFYGCTGLTTAAIENVDSIGQLAFWGCSNLKSITGLESVTNSIGGFAFFGCESLDISNLNAKVLAKMGYVGSTEEIMDRVQDILAGKFQLDNAEQIKELTRDEANWTAGAIGQSEGWKVSGVEYANQSQLMEQARWQNAADGVAEVKVDAYYTGEQQMDYIFVADLSGSMAHMGNPEDSNARFYDMQSKLLDMTGKLLNTDGYDCQVAIVTFGGYVNDSNPGSVQTMAFTGRDKVEEVQNYIKALEPLNENTDYVLGLNEVLDVLSTQQADRNTVVVFLSDGAPNMDGEVKLASATYTPKLRNIATQMAEQKVPAYGVLHSPPAASRKNALAWMEVVCGKGNVYESTDTESFGKAMNAAFTAAYGSNTVTVPVNAKEFDVSGLNATAGTAVYDEESGTITWTLNGMPFTQHTLTYNLTLKSELANRTGTYTYRINAGPATFGENGASVDLDTAPNKLTLTRTVNAPYVPSIPDTNPPTTDIPDENPPLANVDDKLNKTDHFAYVVGYPDGEVKPEQYITRAEAATIFFRLLTDEYRSANWSTENPYPDVESSDWFNNAISTATKAGLFTGYEDGTARPNKPITRAEFATLAARFISDDVTDDGTGDFADTKGHWAAEYIRLAVKAGWIKGMGNNKFEPDRYIKRDEVMTLVNRMLDRVADKDHMLPDMIKWSDNMDTTAWYYADVQEATNGHIFERLEDGLSEKWTSMQKPRDWAALEKEWSTAESGK